MREHVLEPVGEKLVDNGKMAGVFVRGPFSWRGATLENFDGHLLHKWNDELGRALDCVN